MTYINLAILLIIYILWLLGGQKKGRIRDIGVPVLLAFYFAIFYKWWLFFAIGATANIIRLGYGNFEEGEDNSAIADFLNTVCGIKDKAGVIIRTIWGVLVGIVLPLPLLIGGYLIWWRYCLYIALNALIGYLVTKLRLPVILADILVATGVCSIIFLT